VRITPVKIMTNSALTSGKTRSGTGTNGQDHPLAGLRILTVDDDRNTREMLREALERAGAQVMAAESAQDALRKLQGFRPDVLLSDIAMPGEDGCALLREIRRLPRALGGAMPAIAVTGCCRDEDQAATRSAGYQALAPKPVNLDELVSTIVRVAEHSPPG
jgi:CheY-like chemotaxis protein